MNKKTKRDSTRESFKRKKGDPLAANKIEYVDYKDVQTLRKFTSESGRILPARTTGLSRAHQRMVSKAIKRAREIGLLPYAE